MTANLLTICAFAALFVFWGWSVLDERRERRMAAEEEWTTQVVAETLARRMRGPLPPEEQTVPSAFRVPEVEELEELWRR